MSQGCITHRASKRFYLMLLVLSAILFTATGQSCDTEASNTFRHTATGPIGDGVKSITDGIIDGMIAAIEGAGDGQNSATNSSGNGT
jgi:hypothetical protein